MTFRGAVYDRCTVDSLSTQFRFLLIIYFTSDTTQTVGVQSVDKSRMFLLLRVNEKPF